MTQPARSSRPAKACLSILHAAVVAVVLVILFGGEPSHFAQRLGLHATLATPARRALLAGASLLYLMRTVVMLRLFLARRMDWGEAVTVGLLVAAVQLVFGIMGGQQQAPVGLAAAFGAALYLAGSYLNTASEWQRYRWKRDPKNAGRLYTEGLFRSAMHINYFGDVVLFSGWALLTGVPLLLIVPAGMAAGFVFLHIPVLDRRLKEHYGREFDAYAARTRKLIPFLY